MVRRRLDRLIERLKEKQAEDEEREHRKLTEIEVGRIPPKNGILMIENF